MSEKGLFIVFEGIDGAGKTTQIKLLQKRLEEYGRQVYMTCEPTEMPTGRELRRALSGELPKTPCEMAALFTLDRIAHNVDPENGFVRKLNQGIDVICDRYYYSTMAYQGSLTDYDWLKNMNYNCPEIMHPDLLIFLDLTPEQSMERIEKNRTSTEIYENIEQLTKTRNKFMEVLKDLTDENAYVVNAEDTIDNISENIWNIVKNNIK